MMEGAAGHNERPERSWEQAGISANMESVQGTGPAPGNGEITCPGGEAITDSPSTEYAEPLSITETGSSGELVRGPHITILDSQGNAVSEERYQEYMELRRKTMPGQVGLKFLEKRTIDTARRRLTIVAKEIGVDISDRYPHTWRNRYDTYHPYDSGEAMQEDYPGIPPETAAFAGPVAGVVFQRPKEEGGKLTTVSTIYHETVHDLSRSTAVDLDEGTKYPDGTFDGRTGYQYRIMENGLSVPQGEGLNEFATDVGALNIAGSRYNLGYEINHAVFSGAVDEVAHRQGMNHDDIEKTLIRGMLVEDNGTLEVLEDTFGVEGVARIMQARTNQTPEQAIQLSRDLGLGDTADRLAKYDAQARKDYSLLRLMSWRGSASGAQ
jgi:hypothetical protein